MSDPDVTLVAFDQPGPGDAGWVVRVALAGDGFESRAVPVVARVGDVPVEGLVLAETAAVGFLRSVPPVGARLVIGYADQELTETPFTFPGLPNA